MKDSEKLFNLKLHGKANIVIELMNNAIKDYREHNYREYSTHPGKLVDNLINAILNAQRELIKYEIDLRKEIFFKNEIDSEEKRGELIDILDNKKNPVIEGFITRLRDLRIHGDDRGGSNLKKWGLEKFKREFGKFIDIQKSKVDIEFLEKKESKIHKSIEKENKAYQYDVALSYASEDGEYVGKVASFLRDKISCFFDKDKSSELWGEDLPDYLDDVYRNDSLYCMLFISKYYKQKMWTNHERRSALARAVKERRPYILPVRFDDTEIEGLRDTINYFDARKLTPEQIGDAFLKKLGKKIIVESKNHNDEELKKQNFPSVFFTLDPVQIAKGQSATLSWDVKNAISPIIIENYHEKGGEGIYNFGATYKGSYSVHPSDNVTYKLIAKNLFGTVSGTIKLTVTT
jgi:hypothetical protein